MSSSYVDLFPLEGGCSCGHVRYRLALPPLVIHCCHCTACQRETGGAFAINAVIETEHFQLLPSADPSLPGTEAVPTSVPAGPAIETPFVEGSSPTVCVATPTQSKDPQLIYRCRMCATALWSNYGPSAPRDLVRYVRVGTLDRAWEFVASKRDFIALSDGKPQFQRMYQAADVYRPDSMDRLTALMAKIKGTQK
ncbi:glutathione-dependent formaldehyde-activating [Plectosphaerella cucumerina]|uniref:Glutathione-dependent formaldehyde-activating n=1 Tax=Plectosphaerella cucumerina TaxID=40658 RepID=A0A8K0TIV1_9PEZI|nr:glutathione-dependent formaldehyde-activating [Plectosphaerella cucumerina]